MITTDFGGNLDPGINTIIEPEPLEKLDPGPSIVTGSATLVPVVPSGPGSRGP